MHTSQPTWLGNRSQQVPPAPPAPPNNQVPDNTGRTRRERGTEKSSVKRGMASVKVQNKTRTDSCVHTPACTVTQTSHQTQKYIYLTMSWLARFSTVHHYWRGHHMALPQQWRTWIRRMNRHMALRWIWWRREWLGGVDPEG